MAVLEINSIRKNMAPDLVLDCIDLSLNASEIVCLLGPSGCGKTTLLRIIAGLESPDAGEIRFDGRDITRVAPHRREFGMMFQEFALFPHKNVMENVAFGLKIKSVSEAERLRRCNEALELVGLQGMVSRNVNELSGGERQRVALARSLAPQPRLLLLDEPMGSLDRVLRERLIQDLHRILKQIKIPTIFVTHDHNEAFAIADRIAVLNQGHVEQLAKPETLYKQPANEFVASFLGFQNLLPGRIIADKTVRTALGDIQVNDSGDKIGTTVTVLIRPEVGCLLSAGKSAGEWETEISGTIRDIRFQGATYYLGIEVSADQVLMVNLPNDALTPDPGQRIRLALQPAGISLIGT